MPQVGVSQEELLSLLDDPEYDAELPLLRAGPRRLRTQRLVPRTRLSQRINARIQSTAAAPVTRLTVSEASPSRAG